jgi:hypothetical protein
MDRLKKDLQAAHDEIVWLHQKLGAEKLTLVENNKRLTARIRELEKENAALKKRHIQNYEKPHIIKLEDKIADLKEENNQLLYWLHVAHTLNQVIVPDTVLSKSTVDNSPDDT